MSPSEVERHKMYEHPLPVSPFEERFGSDIGKNHGYMDIEDSAEEAINKKIE